MAIERVNTFTAEDADGNKIEVDELHDIDERLQLARKKFLRTKDGRTVSKIKGEPPGVYTLFDRRRGAIRITSTDPKAP